MKKRIWIPFLIVTLVIILFFPFIIRTYKDGGTRSYTSLTYSVVKWNRLVETNTFRKTAVYFAPNNFKGIDALWDFEKDEANALYPSKDFRPLEYTDDWLDKETAEKYENTPFSDIVITEIYSNCFFATSVVPLPMKLS